MTGHLVARSVSLESDGKRDEEVVESERRVDVFVFPKNGQEFLKRASEESLSMVGGRKNQLF